MTGFSPAVRRIITERSQHFCERCGMEQGVEIHHRRARGMGSTKRPNTNLPANGLNLCRDCHSDIEAHRHNARAYGWLLRQNQEPAEVPVLYRGIWVRLDDLGNLYDVEAA